MREKKKGMGKWAATLDEGSAKESMSIKSDTQNAFPGPEAFALPEIMMEMHILGPHP